MLTKRILNAQRARKIAGGILVQLQLTASAKT